MTYAGCRLSTLFDAAQASSIGIIGGADGPTAIFVTSRLAPELLGEHAAGGAAAKGYHAHYHDSNGLEGQEGGGGGGSAYGNAQDNPSNFLLMHAMGPNVAGVIGSAIAAGVLMALFG